MFVTCLQQDGQLSNTPIEYVFPKRKISLNLGESTLNLLLFDGGEKHFLSQHNDIIMFRTAYGACAETNSPTYVIVFSENKNNSPTSCSGEFSIYSELYNDNCGVIMCNKALMEKQGFHEIAKNIVHSCILHAESKDQKPLSIDLRGEAINIKYDLFADPRKTSAQLQQFPSTKKEISTLLLCLKEKGIKPPKGVTQTILNGLSVGPEKFLKDYIEGKEKHLGKSETSHRSRIKNEKHSDKKDKGKGYTIF